MITIQSTIPGTRSEQKKIGIMLTPPTLSRHWPDPKADGIGESTSMASYVSHEISPCPVTMTPYGAFNYPLVI